MWNDRKPWWSRKAKDNNPAENSHYKNWCVVKIATGYKHTTNQWEPIYTFQYKAVARANAPRTFNGQNKLVVDVEVDNLTKHEAHCVAKGLNFLDKE